MSRLRSVVTRYRRRLLPIIMLLLAVVALAPLLGVDPAVFALFLDAEFLVLAGAVVISLLREDVRLLGIRLARSLPVLWVRVGVALTGEAPRSLVP